MTRHFPCVRQGFLVSSATKNESGIKPNGFSSASLMDIPAWPSCTIPSTVKPSKDMLAMGHVEFVLGGGLLIVSLSSIPRISCVLFYLKFKKIRKPGQVAHGICPTAILFFGNNFFDPAAIFRCIGINWRCKCEG